VNHSVTLDKDKCKGCTTCIKHCPTEAIRVRRGRAYIIEERCIDCGECIRVCPHKAKKAVCDSMDRLADFKYNIALPAPSLYGQFRNLDNINIILQGLLDIGFDMVEEVSYGAEIISAETRRWFESKKDLPKPVLSSACPATVRLICMRFPKLIPNILPIIAPVEIAAIKAREEAVRKTGLKPEEIGVFFLTPCPAKVTAIHYPLMLEKPVVDGAISMTEIYKRLLTAMKNVTAPENLTKTGIMGVRWGRSGGETEALSCGNNLSIDGIDNVIKMLEELEDGKIVPADFLELNACNQGCVGGCLTVENPYIAKARIRDLTKILPPVGMPDDTPSDVRAVSLPEHAPVLRLDEDKQIAFEKALQIVKLKEELPGLDCGSCGAPSCGALAEDIVLGFGLEDDCIFRMREKMQNLTGSMSADEYLPPPFRHRDKKQGENENEGI
jgi:Na+-translocating ferredoxin:NAD+ oxidoreductase RNF subunit RnfB